MSDCTVEELSAELAAELAINSQPPTQSPIDPRTMSVRHSRLKLFALSAAHYYESCQRAEWHESVAMRLGSGVHAMVLDQPIARYSARRAGKAWEAFQAEHAGKVILNDREWIEAQRMSAALLRHREAMAILFDGTTIEVPIDWEWLGRKCRSVPDARGSHHVADLKTSRTANPPWFIRDALKMFYHCQLGFYGMAHEFLTGSLPSNHYIVAVEKTPPHLISILRLTERTIEQANKTLRLWMEQLLQCEASGHWPGYAESIVDFDVPEMDMDHPIELEIGGRLVEV